MTEIPKITESDVMHWTNSAYFQRGQNYYRMGAIYNQLRQGMAIISQCSGSYQDYYRQEVEFNEKGILSADCSCPVGDGGYCKHAVALLLAYVYFYDLRGGGVETEIKEDKQGLGTSKRNKKRFEAQYMLTLLEALAHNILVWARQWLAHWCPRIAHFGLLRLVRDAFHMNGLILLDHHHVVKIILSQADPFARELCTSFSALFAQEQIAITLGEI